MPDEQRAIFFVSGPEFDAFRRELDHLSEERPSVHNGWRVSEIPNFAVVDFLLRRFLTSGYLTAQQLGVLGR